MGIEIKCTCVCLIVCKLCTYVCMWTVVGTQFWIFICAFINFSLPRWWLWLIIFLTLISSQVVLKTPTVIWALKGPSQPLQAGPTFETCGKRQFLASLCKLHTTIGKQYLHSEIGVGAGLSVGRSQMWWPRFDPQLRSAQFPFSCQMMTQFSPVPPLGSPGWNLV